MLAGVPLLFAPFAASAFADPKFALLLAGTALIAASRPIVNRRLAVVAAGWVGALLVSSIAGADAWWSVIGAERQNTGVLTLGAGAFLMCAATGLDEDLRSRLPHWIFWTGAVVAFISVVTRFVQFGGPRWRFDALAGTVGHRVFVGAFLAAAIFSAVAIDRHRVHYAALFVMGSGLAIAAARSAWIGMVLGALVVVIKDRVRSRSLLETFVPVVLAIALWTGLSEVLREGPIEYSAAQRFGELNEGSAQERTGALPAFARGWTEDLLTGSGPGTGWGLFLRNASEAEVKVAGRNFGDAHNIFLEIGSTAGIVGLLPLLVMGGMALVGWRRSTPQRAWPAGASVALATVHLLQPLNVVVTPLMLLTAGLAMPSPSAHSRAKVPRVAVVLLALGALAATVRLVSSSFHNYGEVYASESAYRWALWLEPRSLRTTLDFADFRAFDARSGDADARKEVHDLISVAVAQHRWSPLVRLAGANTLTAIDERASADRLIASHIRMFPNDGLALAAWAAVALRRGDLAEAEIVARRALDLAPGNALARSVLDDAARQNSSNQPEASSGPP